MSDTLQNDILDILSITETKLDPSIPKNQFQIEGFYIIINYLIQKSSGIMYIITNILHCRQPE